VARGRIKVTLRCCMPRARYRSARAARLPAAAPVRIVRTCKDEDGNGSGTAASFAGFWSRLLE